MPNPDVFIPAKLLVLDRFSKCMSSTSRRVGSSLEGDSEELEKKDHNSEKSAVLMLG